VEVGVVRKTRWDLPIQAESLGETCLAQEQGKASETDVEDAARPHRFRYQPVGLPAPLPGQKRFEGAASASDSLLFGGQVSMILDGRIPPRRRSSPCQCPSTTMQRVKNTFRRRSAEP
jgi:hypothetical protein